MREDDIVPLMDTLNLLENQHVVNGSTSLFGGAIGGPAPAAGAPVWTVQLPIYGPEKVILAQMEYAKEKFAKIPGARFTAGEVVRTPLSPEAMQRARLVNFGIPNLSTFAMLGRSAARPGTRGRPHWFLAHHSAHRRGRARIPALLSARTCPRSPGATTSASSGRCS